MGEDGKDLAEELDAREEDGLQIADAAKQSQLE